MLAKERAVGCVTSSVLPTPAPPSHVDLEQRCQLGDASVGLLAAGGFLQTPLAVLLKWGSQLPLVKKKKRVRREGLSDGREKLENTNGVTSEGK